MHLKGGLTWKKGFVRRRRVDESGKCRTKVHLPSRWWLIQRLKTSQSAEHQKKISKGSKMERWAQGMWTKRKWLFVVSEEGKPSKRGVSFKGWSVTF